MVSPEFVEIVKLLGLVLGPAGGAWYSVKAALNGTVARVGRIEETQAENHRDTTQALDGIKRDVADVRERVARIEGPQ